MARQATKPGTGERRIPQQARSRRTRERILAAAVICFEARGYDETTTAAIAERAGAGVGTLYGYFPDKRTILIELMHGTLNAIADTVIAALSPARWRGVDRRQSMRELIDAVFRTRQFNPGMQRILWERYFKDADFRLAVQSIEARVREALEGMLSELQRDGVVRVDDVPTAAFVIYTATEWTASRLILGEASADPETAAASVSDMLSRFLFHDEPG